MFSVLEPPQRLLFFKGLFQAFKDQCILEWSEPLNLKIMANY